MNKFFRFLLGIEDPEGTAPAAEEPAEAVQSPDVQPDSEEINTGAVPTELSEEASTSVDDAADEAEATDAQPDADEGKVEEAPTQQFGEATTSVDDAADEAEATDAQPDADEGKMEEAPTQQSGEATTSVDDAADEAEATDAQPDADEGKTEEAPTQQSEEVSASVDEATYPAEEHNDLPVDEEVPADQDKAPSAPEDGEANHPTAETDDHAAAREASTPDEKMQLWRQQSRLEDFLGRIRFRHQRIKLACDGINAWREGKSRISEPVAATLKTLPVKMWGPAFVQFYTAQNLKRDPQGCEEEVRAIVAQYRCSHPDLETADYIESMLEERLGNHSAAVDILQRAVSERKNAGLCALSLARFQIEQGQYDEAAATANYGLCALCAITGSGAKEGALLYVLALARDGQLQAMVHTDTPPQLEEIQSLQRLYRKLLYRFPVSWHIRLHILRRLNILDLMSIHL